MLTIMLLWLLPAVANTSLDAQTSNNVSNTSAVPSSADWTQFLRDNIQRLNPDETVLGVDNVGSLQLKWKTPISGGSSPAVANGVVYVGSDDGNVYALNASTGAKVWSYATGGGSPTIVNGVVYVASGVNVYALNASTGAKLWSYAATFLLLNPFAVANGVVYVSSDDVGTIIALNASTGSLLWSYNTSAVALTPPVVANGMVYFGDDINNVYALNASTGALIWSYATEGIVVSSPVVANGVVYVGDFDGETVYALNANTGAKLWSYATGGMVISSPVVAGGVVYVGPDDGNLYALNAGTGAKLWIYKTGGGFPTIVNGVVYIGAGDGNVYALNASTGAKLWSYAVMAGTPVVANGVVYFGAGDGNVYALNASNGAKLWSYTTGGGSPVIVNGVVYVNGSGNIYAFSVGADLFLRVQPSTTTVHQGDLLTFAFPVWNLGPVAASQEVLNTQVPAGTTFEYIRISGTPGLGTCVRPPYHGTGQVVCHENASMAHNTTWTVRLTVKVTAPSGTVITENAATMSDTFDPNTANNMATVSLKVQ